MEPWHIASKKKDFILSENFLLPELLLIIIEFAFELDIFYNFHKLFKTKTRWSKSRPSYPYRAKFASIGFVSVEFGDFEILIGDICGVFFCNEHLYAFQKHERCELLDEIIMQSNKVTTIHEAARLDAKLTLSRILIPKICAHAALHRLNIAI